MVPPSLLTREKLGTAELDDEDEEDDEDEDDEDDEDDADDEEPKEGEALLRSWRGPAVQQVPLIAAAHGAVEKRRKRTSPPKQQAQPSKRHRARNSTNSTNKAPAHKPRTTSNSTITKAARKATVKTEPPTLPVVNRHYDRQYVQPGDNKGKPIKFD